MGIRDYVNPGAQAGSGGEKFLKLSATGFLRLAINSLLKLSGEPIPIVPGTIRRAVTGGPIVEVETECSVVIMVTTSGAVAIPVETKCSNY